MFYLTSKFHDNCVNTFGFMEGGGGLLRPPQAQELRKSQGRIGLSYQSLCYSPVKFYGHRCKVSRVGTFYVAVIRGESCFEKHAFEDTEKPARPPQLEFLKKEYLRKYSRYRKKICFILKLFLRPILFHGKVSFDNLTYFKLYGNLNIN